jgi:dienelactone hydrolase
MRAPLIEPRQATGPDQPHFAVFMNRRYFDFQRRLAYPDSRDEAPWQRWRRSLRRSLRRTLCLDQLGPVPIPEPTILATTEEDGYTRHRIAYETLTDNWVSAYLLVPPGAEKKPAVLCPHGHVPGAKEGVVDPANAPGRAYGREFARRGLVVLAPDNAGMGERDAENLLSGGNGGCMQAWVRLNHMGLDLTGLRVFDLMAGVNLLAARPDVDARRLGCAGLSGGCWLSQVTTALERRIGAVVLSGFFTTFAQTVWHGHCICHHPFGIGRFCDMPDLSALIAPRPQFVESGTADANYPHQPAFSLVQRAYDLLDASGNLGLHRYRGGHEFRGVKSIPWLARQLAS